MVVFTMLSAYLGLCASFFQIHCFTNIFLKGNQSTLCVFLCVCDVCERYAAIQDLLLVRQSFYLLMTSFQIHQRLPGVCDFTQILWRCILLT